MVTLKYHQNGLERVLWHAKALMTSSKPRKRTHEASIHNMAHEDNLLSVIWSYETCWRFWSIL